MIAVALASIIAGAIPQTLVAPSRVVWIDGDATAQVYCRVESPARWECDGVPEPPRGGVVIVGENGVVYHPVATGDERTGPVKAWGRVVVVTPGAVSPDDTRDVQIAAWVPARSRARTQSKRFTAEKEPTIDVIRVRGTTFWIAGGVTDADAFLAVDGSAVGSTRVAVSALTGGSPEAPVYVPAAMPFSLAGYVQTSRGEGVGGADVELFQPLSTTSTLSTQTANPAVDLASQSLIRAAVTRSDQNGRFSFDRLSVGPFLVSVLDGARGRGTAVVQSLGEPLVVRLVPPFQAAGRVLRNRLPIANARVRFVPSMDALLKSADAMELIAEERTTGVDGRFTFALPPLASSGTLQVIGPDGASTRLAVSRPNDKSEIDVGDIILPDHRQLTVRVLNGDGCGLSAVGPLGGLGLTTVRATTFGPTHVFDIPEPGEWALDAECGGESRGVDPLVVRVAASAPSPIVDVRIVR